MTAAPSVRSEPTEKRIRAYADGRLVADSRRARIVWFGPVARTYAVPVQDVRGRLREADGHAQDPIMGRVPAASMLLDGRAIEAAALLPAEAPGLDDHVILGWDAMDTWLEEDDQVFVHPHDPHKRIDILRSSRQVVVELDGERIAETRRPTLLFETHLPTRYYLPRVDLEWDLLVPSDTRSGCAYKGFARYFHARVAGSLNEDVLWTYRTPLPEAQAVAGLFGVFQERTDVTVDGEPIGRPRTPWTREP